MNKSIFILAFLILFTSGSASAQSFYRRNQPDNLIKANIISPVAGTASLFYERAITPRRSAQIGLSYTGASGYRLRLRGFGVTPEMRFYVMEGEPQLTGLFIAPFLRYRFFSLTGFRDGHFHDVALHTYGLGFLVGYQQIYNNRFSLEGFIGPDYNFPNWQRHHGLTNVINTYRPPGMFVTGFGIRAGVTIGLGF